MAALGAVASFCDQSIAGDTSAAATGAFKSGDWPFLPLARPAVPEVTRLGNWVRNPIDAFVAEKLEGAGISPSAPAEKLLLLRRVTYDLTGLPPTPQEQADFLGDTTPDAYAKVVDRLLASPRYGERWAQHWLDLVRYSETEGFKKDGVRPDAYKYRDYVIQAFNDDLPYDQFIRQQLAGDELEPNNPQAMIATGLLRLYPEEANASNLVQERQEILDDLTENTSLAFLGLTVGCARCHDHKFDPIKQVDYYRLQACFAAVLPDENVCIATAEQKSKHDERMTKWEEATKSIRSAIDSELADERQAAMQDAISAYDPDTVKAINTPPEKRNCMQKQLVAETEEWVESRLERAYRRCAPDERKQYDDQMTELAKFDTMKPEPLPRAMAVFDGDAQAPATCVLAGGDFHKPGKEVTAGFPEFLGASEPDIKPPIARPNSTGRRSALANWLTRPDHPLTARVIVNRLWQFHFGQGIVATTNDFGAMGGNPSHQELLDWLAAELVANGWHLKPLQRLMVMSAVYCQSSQVDSKDHPEQAKALAADAANNLLWHARRQRLEGESLRDAMLQVSDQLNMKMFGPSALPVLPAVLADSRYSWDPDAKPVERNRRSIYVFAKRNMRLPLFEAFDQPDMHNSCPRRTNTTTAPQALELLNGELTDDAARHWSGKLLTDCGDDEAKLVREAYQLAYGRPPKESEIEAAAKFIEADAEKIAHDAVKLDEKHLPAPLPEKIEQARGAAVLDFCHAVLCSNEFLYVD